MKKNILIFCTILSTFSLTAFGYFNWNNSTAQKEIKCKTVVKSVEDLELPTCKSPKLDLIYNVSSRFIHTVTKENLISAKNIFDILPQKAFVSVEDYHSVQVAILEDNEEITEHGENDILTTNQIKLLKSTDYSGNLYVRADYKVKNNITGLLENDYLTYYMTIVPEEEAEYFGGKEGLITYLKENSKRETEHITLENLKPGKVNFTISKEGRIKNVELSSTCGYNTVDDFLVNLVSNIPGNWKPASNSVGDKVAQEFVFFFGLEGC